MRILIVEDEHGIAEAIRKGLIQEKYTVDVAYDGQTGYDLGAAGVYDVVILDVMLPQMDGVELCRQLRQNQIHTPVLMLTAKSTLPDKVQGLDVGADDYLTKPFAFEELLARIRALSRRPSSIQSAIVQVRELALDPKTFSVTRAEQNIELSAREFSLLEYLMRQSPNIVSKDQIIEHVWDYESEILPNTIEVYIKNLRKKIDLPYPMLEPLIQTVRGFGYRIK